jgi:hypothetical protein
MIKDGVWLGAGEFLVVSLFLVVCGITIGYCAHGIFTGHDDNVTAEVTGYVYSAHSYDNGTWQVLVGQEMDQNNRNYAQELYFDYNKYPNTKSNIAADKSYVFFIDQHNNIVYMQEVKSGRWGDLRYKYGGI